MMIYARSFFFFHFHVICKTKKPCSTSICIPEVIPNFCCSQKEASLHRHHHLPHNPPISALSRRQDLEKLPTLT